MTKRDETGSLKGTLDNEQDIDFAGIYQYWFRSVL